MVRESTNKLKGMDYRLLVGSGWGRVFWTCTGETKIQPHTDFPPHLPSWNGTSYSTEGGFKWCLLLLGVDVFLAHLTALKGVVEAWSAMKRKLEKKTESRISGNNGNAKNRNGQSREERHKKHPIFSSTPHGQKMRRNMLQMSISVYIIS